MPTTTGATVCCCAYLCNTSKQSKGRARRNKPDRRRKQNGLSRLSGQNGSFVAHRREFPPGDTYQAWITRTRQTPEWKPTLALQIPNLNFKAKTRSESKGNAEVMQSSVVFPSRCDNIFLARALCRQQRVP